MDEFDPTFMISTLLDPHYKLVLCEKQIRATKEALIHHITEQKNGNGTSSPNESPQHESELEPFMKRFCYSGITMAKRTICDSKW